MTEKNEVQIIKNLCNHNIIWKKVDTIKINSNIDKPQGLVKIKDKYYLTSAKFTSNNSGEGILHIIDENGNLLQSHIIATGLIFHPGGIDVENEKIWIPVSEFGPNTNTVILQIAIFDSNEIEIMRSFKFADHLSLLFSSNEQDIIFGYNWGSTIFYKIFTNDILPSVEKFTNTKRYIDYQDCKKIDDDFVLCLGRKDYEVMEIGKVSIAGLDLIKYQSNTLNCTIPVELWLKPYITMAKNPFWFDIIDSRLQFYFIPEYYDGNIHIYTPELEILSEDQNCILDRHTMVSLCEPKFNLNGILEDCI